MRWQVGLGFLTGVNGFEDVIEVKNLETNQERRDPSETA